MAENKKNDKPTKFRKPGGSSKPDDNFDWSKIIRLVFGWGAVVIAAVIVMQLFKSGSTNYVGIHYDQYLKLLNEDKIAKATITKADINDYYFKAELKGEESLTINNKELRVKEISVYLPEPIVKDQEVIWRTKF